MKKVVVKINFKFSASFLKQLVFKSEINIHHLKHKKMKKTILTVLTFIGLSMGTANAQSCCTTQKEECKPKVCCPTISKCCEDDKSSLDSKEAKNKAYTVKTINNKTVARKEEVAVVEPKKTKI